MLNLLDRRLNTLHFWVTTSEHGAITLNDDFSFTLKIEVLEDDEKTLIEQNMAAADKLTLVLEGLDLFGATGQWRRTDPAPATRSIPTTRAMSSSRTGWLRRLVGQTVLSKK